MMKALALKIYFEMVDNSKKEAVDLKKIRSWADKVFPSGYTIYLTKGVWKGKTRDSFTIERYDKNLKLLKDKAFLGKIKELASHLKQEEILLTGYIVKMENITT